MGDGQEFRRYVESRHEAGVSTAAVLDIARRATGLAPRSVTRVKEGVANEVYFASIQGSADVVVRIAPRPAWFEREAGAIRRAAEAGAPVPRVLLVDDVEFEGVLRSVMVAERLPGVPITTHVGPDESLAPFVDDLATALDRTWKIPVEGWGLLDSRGVGGWPTWQGWLRSRLHAREDLLRAADGADLDPALVARAHAAVLEASAWEDVSAGLVHGDLSPGHVIVSDGRVTGVVDWELASAAHPTYDLAYWHFFSGGWVTAERLAPTGSFEQPGFTRLFHIHRLVFALRYLHRATIGGGYSGTLRFVRGNLPDALEALGH